VISEKVSPTAPSVDTMNGGDSRVLTAADGWTTNGMKPTETEYTAAVRRAAWDTAADDEPVPPYTE